MEAGWRRCDPALGALRSSREPEPVPGFPREVRALLSGACAELFTKGLELLVPVTEVLFYRRGPLSPIRCPPPVLETEAEAWSKDTQGPWDLVGGTSLPLLEEMASNLY